MGHLLHLFLVALGDAATVVLIILALCALGVICHLAMNGAYNWDLRREQQQQARRRR